jgi:hypothetical protein
MNAYWVADWITCIVQNIEMFLSSMYYIALAVAAFQIRALGHDFAELVYKYM